VLRSHTADRWRALKDNSSGRLIPMGGITAASLSPSHPVTPPHGIVPRSHLLRGGPRTGLRGPAFAPGGSSCPSRATGVVWTSRGRPASWPLRAYLLGMHRQSSLRGQITSQFETSVYSALNLLSTTGTIMRLPSELRPRIADKCACPPKVKASVSGAKRNLVDRWLRCAQPHPTPGYRTLGDRATWSTVSGRGPVRRRRAVLLLSRVVLLTPMVVLLGIRTASASDDALRKVGPELQALYRAYLEREQPGHPLVLPIPGMRVVEDRVLIDAVASDGVVDLKADLIALGMRNAEAAGRIVSGQLPIAAIPAMAALPSLRFARAAITAPHGGADEGVH